MLRNKYSKKENVNFLFNWSILSDKMIIMSHCESYFRSKILFQRYFLEVFLKTNEKVKLMLPKKGYIQ
jgi:hypothetical protein